MACLETTPQMYSKWWEKKSLKDKIEINNVNPQNGTILSVASGTSSVKSVELDEFEKKVLALKSVLNRDSHAADLKWSLFVAACNTYRHDSCLKPFPSSYIQGEFKDIEKLRKVVEGIPPFAIIYDRLEDTKLYETYKEAIELLYWVLITHRDPYLKSAKKENYETILSKVPSEVMVARPNLIFQVATPNQSSKEDRWKASIKGHSTFYAYHGSRLENFHSIIHYGIQQHMSQPGLFGDGIYLSSELGVSLGFSPVGYGWGGSMLGSEISCIALCEVINHPDVKKGDTTRDVPKGFELSVRNKIPNKYYLVQNSDLVRIRHLLVYSQDFCSLKKTESTGIVGWFKQNKFLTFVLGYVVLLVSVGLSQNRSVEKYYRLFIQKAGLD
ncbi:mono [ADP-ribose] polymerase PARP16 [Fopius arisanus]|uniref:Poly [ADP-ribose] polymerase n=3 Tax=Fopius arisanus TaxID=64838 RepID=A0A9R1SWD2_9HYME|nr:PREDICTED: mono [ADP-ribose] polymerase PARP16 [Fopius arisanus]XP_011298348.1 PREDICTED: mono [ADP-ribose] polymerase PARP16 [Fopius arisanus]XP_011298349.1 PREDICTED: mono [ADP-ribose] polymerase PARP16 [Fopius arisanus]XP_011298350.1 PREDICTED: mono [ADP-ribose] polymerase PARP16 [Fopius arisanus]